MLLEAAMCLLRFLGDGVYFWAMLRESKIYRFPSRCLNGKVRDNAREILKDGEGDLLPSMWWCGLRGRQQIQHVWLVGVDIAVGI